MRADFDVAVIGSGFAGSLMAMIARRIGRSVILIERGRHPRFAIGESSTPLANLLLEELARRYDLPALLPLCKWGTWQGAYPQIACGLKRGFTFFHHRSDERSAAEQARKDQLLVGASPNERIADTHWYRPDFDAFLVAQAQKLGVEFSDETQLHRVLCEDGGLRFGAERAGRAFEIRTRFVIDASGPRGFLHREMRLGERDFPHFPKTQALFSHFTGVEKWSALYPWREAPPYPPDDAAMHHLFEGGWIWLLRFNNGLTSAGIAATDALATKLHLAEGAAAWTHLLARLPSVRHQFANARSALPFYHLPRLAFRTTVAAGENWALLPSAAGVVDPLLSTGFPLTLLGIERLARLLASGWSADELIAYGERTLAELDATALLVAALYANLHDLKVFSALTLLYFAAASFSEAARRLHRSELARSFLLSDHPRFGLALRDCCTRALHLETPAQRAAVIEEIHAVIEPFDIAGLGDRNRAPWFPARADDFLASAGKLGATRAQAEQALARAGFLLPAT